MAHTIEEFVKMKLPPDTSIEDEERAKDAYYKELGDLLEQHPPRNFGSMERRLSGRQQHPAKVSGESRAGSSPVRSVDDVDMSP